MDANAYLVLDPEYAQSRLLTIGNLRRLLGTGNFHEGGDREHGRLEVEWERYAVPRFALPAPYDRMTVWGEHIWDCGHGQHRGDDTYRTEIHPPVGWVVYRNLADFDGKPDSDDGCLDQLPAPNGDTFCDPWQWYKPIFPSSPIESHIRGDRQGIGALIADGPGVPIQATVADMFFSSFGGGVQGSLNGCHDSGTFLKDPIGAENAPCTGPPRLREWWQPLLADDYSFFVPAPPPPPLSFPIVRPTLIWELEDRCTSVPPSPANPPGDDVEGLGEAGESSFLGVGSVSEARNLGPARCLPPPMVVEGTDAYGRRGVNVTVRAESSGIDYPANRYVAYAGRLKVGWDYLPPESERPRIYEVHFRDLWVYHDGEPCFNDGEWIVTLRANEQWIHPVRGRGDHGRPFWTNGAVNDRRCPIPIPGRKRVYQINERLILSVLPPPWGVIDLRASAWDQDPYFPLRLLGEVGYDFEEWIHPNDAGPILNAVKTGASPDVLVLAGPNSGEMAFAVTYTITQCATLSC